MAVIDYEDVFRQCLDVRSISGDELVCLCPFHGDSSPSLWANRKKGLWVCYACGEKGGVNSLCRRLGFPAPESMERTSSAAENLFQVREVLSRIAAVETASRCSCWEVISRLRSQKSLVRRIDGFPEYFYNLVLQEESSSKLSSSSLPLDFTGSDSGRCKKCDSPLILSEKYLLRFQKESSEFIRFLDKRNISNNTKEEVEEDNSNGITSSAKEEFFGVKDNSVISTGSTTSTSNKGEDRLFESSRLLFQLGWDSLNRSVTIPYRDSSGLLLGVVRRRMNGRPKYYYPRRFPRTENLFGSWLLHRPEEELPPLRRILPKDWVVLCEGSLDTIRVWQAGVPSVAMWGSRLHEKQVQILLSLGVRGVCVFTDRDSAGRQASLFASEMLSKAGISVSRVFYPKSYPESFTDPGSLPDAMIRSRVARARRYFPH